MLENHNNSMCPREDQILSYLYRELTPVETERFEAHLASCGSCVDELAEISESHLSVYEWRTNVFDKFPSPSIEFQSVDERPPHAEGLLGRLTALLAGWPVGLRVGVGFAAVLVLGLSAFLLTRPVADVEVARNQTVSRVTERVSTEEQTPSPEADEAAIVVPPAENVTGNLPTESVAKTTRVKHITNPARNAAAGRSGRTELASNPKERSTTRPSLRLNTFEEDEDTTLRLADLFEEVGSL